MWGDNPYFTSDLPFKKIERFPKRNFAENKLYHV